MRVDVITLFPEWFEHLTDLGVTGRGISAGTIDLHVWNPRDYSTDKHHSTDARPYGGGPGMVMLAEPLFQALQAVKSDSGSAGSETIVSALSPQGRRLSQLVVNELAQRSHLILICGRYEGIDQRFIDCYVDEQLSLGDFVLSGGELAAAAVIDAVARLLPGVLGHSESAKQDSFAVPEHRVEMQTDTKMNEPDGDLGESTVGVLDCPHYTRPENWQGIDVPPVLLSGNHAEIAKWRRQKALLATWKQRPDLLKKTKLSFTDQQLLEIELQKNNG